MGCITFGAKCRCVTTSRARGQGFQNCRPSVGELPLVWAMFASWKHGNLVLGLLRRGAQPDCDVLPERWSMEMDEVAGGLTCVELWGGQGIICAHKSGSSVHTGFPHLLRHALWIICAHKVSVIWLICTHTHTHFWQGGGVGGGDW